MNYVHLRSKYWNQPKNGENVGNIEGFLDLKPPLNVNPIFRDFSKRSILGDVDVVVLDEISLQ